MPRVRSMQTILQTIKSPKKPTENQKSAKKGFDPFWDLLGFLMFSAVLLKSGFLLFRAHTGKLVFSWMVPHERSGNTCGRDGEFSACNALRLVKQTALSANWIFAFFTETIWCLRLWKHNEPTVERN